MIEWHLILEDGDRFRATRDLTNRFGGRIRAGTVLTWYADIRGLGARTRPSVWFRDEDIGEDDIAPAGENLVATNFLDRQMNDTEGNGLLF